MKKILYYIDEVNALIDSIPIEKRDQNLIEDFNRFSKIFWNYYKHEYQNIPQFNNYYIASDEEILKIKLYSIRDKVLELIEC